MEDAKFIKTVLEDLKLINTSLPRIIRSGDLFSIWFTSNILLTDTDEDTALNYFIGGSNDNKLDIGIADDDHELIILGQSKFPNGNKLITDIQEADVEIGNYTKDKIDEIITAKSRLTSDAVTGNQNWTNFVKDYKERIAPEDANVKLVFAGFGNFLPEVMAYALEKNIDVYDFKRMKDLYIRKHSLEGAFDVPDSIELHCKEGNTKYEGRNFSTFSYFADINDIGSAVEKYQDGLFIENLRYKLYGSAQSKIAADIEDTIKKNPEKLTILNNGLTVVVEKLNSQTNPIKLIKPRIVNGCQTSWAIYNRYVKAKDAGKTLEGYVYVRIIQTNDPNYIKEVTNATNNQNPITARDKHADDSEQREIFSRFSNFDHKKIIYDYREGLIDALKRNRSYVIESCYINMQGRGKPKLRSIDNVTAGQLYLALLGEPIFAKTDKKQIFEETEIYKTIFYYQLPKDERFNNDTIGIKANDIKLRTGSIDYFIEDVLFAFAVKKLADAFAGLYDRKVSLYGESERTTNPTNIAYKELVENFSFVKRWNLIVVAAVNYIVNTLARDEADMKNIRERLIKSGIDIDMFWRNTSKIEDQFNFNDDLSVVSIVNEESPSANYVIFGKWIRSISLIIYNLVRAEKAKEGEAFNMRKFIELNPTTYTNLIAEIGRTLALGESERKSKFPIT